MDGDGEVTTEVASHAVGDRLRQAREAAGLTREDIAARTKIAERHLVAIEENRFSDLASRTYAVGFSRTFARAVGLNEVEIADAVRSRLDEDEQAWPRSQPEAFEPGDPARVPSARLAWIAGSLGLLGVLSLLVLFWPSFLSPQGSPPGVLNKEPAMRQPTAAVAHATPAGAVVFTATEPSVWVKFYDADDNQLFQKEMALGESFTVPASASGPMLRTARPDALAITIGGKRVPKISDKLETVRDVPVSAAALLSRGKAAQPAPFATPASEAQPVARQASGSLMPQGAAVRNSQRAQTGADGATQAAPSAAVANPAPARAGEEDSMVSPPTSTDSE